MVPPKEQRHLLIWLFQCVAILANLAVPHLFPCSSIDWTTEFCIALTPSQPPEEIMRRLDNRGRQQVPGDRARKGSSHYILQWTGKNQFLVNFCFVVCLATK